MSQSRGWSKMISCRLSVLITELSNEVCKNVLYERSMSDSVANRIPGRLFDNYWIKNFT